MRVFHKNKSQASLLGSHETRSQDNPPQSAANPRSAPQLVGDQFGNSGDPFQHQRYSQAIDQFDYGYTHPAHAVNRSYSTRLPSLTPLHSHEQPGRPTLNVVPGQPTGPDPVSPTHPDDPAWTPQSPDSSPQVESQPRKRRGLFGLGSSKDKDKDSSHGTKVLSRNISRRKAGHLGSSKKNPPNEQGSDSTHDYQGRTSIDSRMPQNSSRVSQPGPQPPYPPRNDSRPAIHSESQDPDHPSIQRVSTDPDSYYQQQRQGEDLYEGQLGTYRAPQYQEELIQPTPQHPHFQITHPQRRQSTTTSQHGGPPEQGSLQSNHSPQLDTYHTIRPPSQQSFGPPSPLHPQYQSIDSQQKPPSFRQSLQPTDGPIPPQGSMAPDRQTGLRQPMESTAQHGQARDPPIGPPPPYNQPLPNLPQGSSFKGSNMSQQSLGESGRETPPPGKAREDMSDADVRALQQEYRELRRSPCRQHKLIMSFSARAC